LTLSSVEALAAPGRLAGLSGRELDKTAAFNELPEAYEKEPERPHYLDEDNRDARFAAAGNEDRYNIPHIRLSDAPAKPKDGPVGKPEESYDYDEEENYDEDEF